MRAGLGITVVLIISTILAGCAGGASKELATTPTAAPPTISDNAGAIEGSVTDESLNPIAGAQVLVRETNQKTATDAAGAFTINDLPTGSYTLFVAAIGFEAVSRRVTVTAGEILPLRVTLISIAVVEPYSYPLIFEGYMQCTWRAPTGTGPCGYNVYDASAQFPNNKRAFLYNIFPHMRTFIGELQWTSGSAATTNTMTLLLSYANRTDTHLFGSKEGASPVRQVCERTADEWLGCDGGSQALSEKPEISEEKGLYMRSFVSTGRARPAGVASPVNYGITMEQGFYLYITVFYGEPAPPNFSALPDA